MKLRLFIAFLFIITTLPYQCFAKTPDPTKKNTYLSISSGFSLNSGRETSFSGINQKTYTFIASSKSTSIANNAVFQAEIGRRFDKRLRSGISLLFLPPSTLTVKANSNTQNDILVGHISSCIIMGNIYYHVPFEFTRQSIFSPYITSGAGLAINTLNDLKNFEVPLNEEKIATTSILFNNSTSSFAWQIGAGSVLKIYKNLDIDINYKFLDRGKAHTKNSFLEISDPEVPPLPSTGTFEDTARATFKRLYSHQIMIGAIMRF